MIVILCLIISMISIPVCMGVYFMYRRTHAIHLLYMLILGVAISLTFIYLPCCIDFFSDGSQSKIKIAGLAVYSAFSVFGGNGSFEFIVEHLKDVSPWIMACYQVWSSILYVIAPLLTIGAILLIFNSVQTNMNYLLSYKKLES